MKFKVKFFDKKIFDQWLCWMGGAAIVLNTILFVCDFSEIISAVGIAKSNVPLCCRLSIGVVAFFITYGFVFWLAKRKKSTNITIGGNSVSICSGDIFDDKIDGLKVISFNEYYDTIVDDIIISKKSLHGQFLEKYRKDIPKIDELVEKDAFLQQKEKIDINKSRKGKITRFKLGSLILYNNYILTAMTKFDDENRAQLTYQQFVNFLQHLWENIDRVYADRTVTMPILGSGITRFTDGGVSKQKCIELLLMTFKLSAFCREHNDINLNIVVREKDVDKIDFYHLEG